MAEPDIDLRAAINAISDVIQNRPRPLREIDQIYMKAGDMVLQSEVVARWAQDKKLAFIGDGDAISVCVTYLQRQKILTYGPSEVVVFDFDERICGAVNRFADKEQLPLSSQLYNCLDRFPEYGQFDFFYTNPPWGASNDGESVKVFMQRGMEANGFGGEGIVVVADDDELSWTQQVLLKVQQFTTSNGYFISRMMPRLHQYHLDDDPDLRSCNLMLKALADNQPATQTSEMIDDPDRLRNFYGQDNPPKIKYVRERQRVDYGKALDEEYFFEVLKVDE